MVSVIAIFLNEERFIREAIESVVAQTYDAWELLLVDDGSTDASTEIAQRYAERYPGKIRYLEHGHHANRGMSASRNLGILNARGEYLAFLDADDVWFPQKLDRQVAILRSHPEAAMVFGRSQYWNSWTGNSDDGAKDNIPELGVQADVLFRPPAMTTLLYPLGLGTAPCPSDLMLRRDAVARVGGFEESFTGNYQMYEDQAFLAKVYLNETVFVSSECWARYRIHVDSCMSVVVRNGHYWSVRRFFLNWLENYLREQRLQDKSVWSALQKALVAMDDLRAHNWQLRVAGGSDAVMIFPPDDPNGVRIAIEKATTKTGHDIQLNQPRLKVKANHRYRIQFRARADRERSIVVGFAQGHEPWQGLGLYERADLTGEWQSYEHEFLAAADESNARIHFDVGDSDISVELAAVGLFSLSDEAFIVPELQATTNGTAQADQELSARVPPLGEVRFGALRRVTPISRNWGLDRGRPVDRYYIENFLAAHSEDVRGRVLEIGDNSYTRQFGAGRVARSDVLHVSDGNPVATMVADLACAPQIPTNSFDCIIITQTLQLIYDVRAAIQTLYRILAPGGVLLATFPGISQTGDQEWGNHWYWAFTTLSARRLFEEVFSAADLKVAGFGNVLSATSFLQGLATEELTRAELDHHEPGYDVTVTVRALKPKVVP